MVTLARSQLGPSSLSTLCPARNIKGAVAAPPCCRGFAAVSIHKLQKINFRIHSIGFNFGDEPKETESTTFFDASLPRQQPGNSSNRIKTAGYKAASLLVYYSIAKSSVGEAYLNLASTMYKASSSNKDIVEAFTSFYQKLAISGYSDWEDFVLDQILLGRDNPFARAVAQGDLQGDAPMIRAAQHDLDVLQDLCVSQEQLATYLGEIVPTIRDSFVEAAMSASVKAGKLMVSTAEQYALRVSETSKFIKGPLTSEQLAAWKSAIASKTRWSEALPLVQQYYHMHGYGLTSRNSTLRWNNGALEEAGAGQADFPTVHIEEYVEERFLVDNMQRHLEGLPADHVLLAGPSGNGKSHMMWETLLIEGKERGLRLVDVPAREVGNIVEIARGCAKYPRVRFILVADHVEFPLKGNTASDLMSGLSGAGGSGWPSNTLLYMGATPSSQILPSDPITNRCAVVVLNDLTEDMFMEAVRQLSTKEGVTVSLTTANQAIGWARANGGLNLRSAHGYLHVLRMSASGEYSS